MPTLVLFGATGYTGRLTARAMVDRGLEPVLAGRSRDELRVLADELGGLPTAVADAEDVASVASLVDEGDVLVSTVGPFTLYGDAALSASVTRGAHYIDSTGEPGFIRKVFRDHGDDARERDIALLTASGYDYVPGHCAAAVAMREAGAAAERVAVGYYSLGAFSGSQGTRASSRVSLADPGMVYRSGTLVEEYSGMDVASFPVEGVERPALSVPGSEHYSLPRLFPHLTDVRVFLGWFGDRTRALHWFARVQAAAMKVPGVRPLVRTLVQRNAHSEGEGPAAEARAASRSHIIAEASDATGAILSRTRMTGVDGYDFTAAILAWMAERVLEDGVHGAGALGPVEAFGLDPLIEGCREAGLTLASGRGPELA